MKLAIYLLLASMLINVAEAQSKVTAFLSKYCYDCHDEDIQKGGVRLDNLSKNLADSATLKKWVLIHDVVKHGDMPPKKKKKQPTSRERQELAKLMAPVLHSADAKQKEVVLRRLNREEIQNTVNDLFKINLNLKHLLPEDAVTKGFDNIGSGLSMSTELMQSYLEFADQVVEHAIVKDRKPKIIDKTYNFKDINRVKKNSKRIRTVEDGIVLYHQNDLSSSTLYEFRASFRGKHRIKIKFGAWQNKDNLPMKLRIYAGNFGIAGQWANYGFFDVPLEGKTEVVVEPYLRRGETLRVVAYNTNIYYLKNASTEKRGGVWVGDIHVHGPLLESWPVYSKASIFGSLDTHKAGDAEARQIISRFLPKAFRRPVASDEIEGYHKLYKEIHKKSGSFEEGIKVVLKAVLCSADFLYLIEEGGGGLSDYELASRLSYFLWSSCPDEELFNAAKKGELRNPVALRAQTERMLKDEKSARFVKNFTGQWLKLRQVDDTVPDKKLYPEYDEYLRYSLLEETELFFKKILNENLSLLNFIDSDFIIVNDRMAEHYGIKGVKGSSFREIKVPANSPRGGVLTQASIMKVTANGTDTSPILRGVWMLENIMGVHIPPPPPAVPAVEPDIRGAVTIRQQLDAHKKNSSCFGCHTKIDPVGFAFENFDPVGTWRSYYRTLGGKGKHVKSEFNGRRVHYRVGPDVDASGVYESHGSFKGVQEFKKILLKSPQKISHCLTEKLMTYALGRVTGFSDRPELNSIVSKNTKEGYGLRSLVHAIVQSNIFKNH